VEPESILVQRSFLSLEPLLGPVHLTQWITPWRPGHQRVTHPGRLHWVIVGGERPWCPADASGLRSVTAGPVQNGQGGVLLQVSLHLSRWPVWCEPGILPA